VPSNGHWSTLSKWFLQNGQNLAILVACNLFPVNNLISQVNLKKRNT
jgi:hypothetical protein